MKKVAILLFAVITVSSCSIFEKPSMNQNEIDGLINQKAKVEAELASIKQENELLKLRVQECAKLIEQQTAESQVKGKYSVIVGSFKNSKYAADYAAKMKEKGGEGGILAGPSDFNFVVYSSHPTLKEAAGSMRNLRKDWSPDAWIWMNR
jgi:hypothetical protein